MENDEVDVLEAVLPEPETSSGEMIDEKSFSEFSLQEYCFETEHVALKGNKDYSALLRTILILETQQKQAIQNLEKLNELKEKALQNPLEFLKQMENGERMGMPPLITIAQIPDIDWAQYKSGRQKTAAPVQSHSIKTTMDQIEEEEGRHLRHRGRDLDGSRPETFNRLWTDEEQRRLEELLVVFPPEEIEMRRWERIAKALGNRTTLQVASRVQKYFLKLYRAGVPYPGRLPRRVDATRSRFNHPRQRHKYKPMSMFPRLPRKLEPLSSQNPAASDLGKAEDRFTSFEDFLQARNGNRGPIPGPSRTDDVERIEESSDEDDDEENEGKELVDEEEQQRIEDDELMSSLLGMKEEIYDDEETDNEDNDNEENDNEENDNEEAESEESDEDDDETMDIAGKLDEARRERTIELLERVMEEKDHSDASGATHAGFTCDYCQEEPIVGTRWHCNDCADVDFCSDCLVTQLDARRPHPLDHRLQALRYPLGASSRTKKM